MKKQCLGYLDCGGCTHEDCSTCPYSIDANKEMFDDEYFNDNMKDMGCK